MRVLLCPVVLLGLLVCMPSAADARCGDRPGDRAAVDSAVGAIVAECCCTLPAQAPRRVSGPSCARRVAVLLIADDALPHRCAPLAVHTARRVCRAREQKPSCVPATTTTTLPVASCRTPSDCDDGNGCSIDSCVRGRCVHVCRCYGPGGSLTCCPGPSVLCSRLHYFPTCGYPVCPMVPKPIPGLPACTTQHPGDPCTTPGKECDPGTGCGVRLRCDDHAPPAGSCPISQRAAKRDVAYLTPADADRLRDQLLALPLATYRYRSEDAVAASHLGFVIDDVGEIPAVAPGRTMVDVYGYTTMAVAAIQAQQRQIARLEQEMDDLRRECRPARRR